MTTSRAETSYRWYVTCGMPTYSVLAGVSFDRVFREADAIVEAYTVGHARARELYGPDIQYGGPGWAGISYGHVNCLGSPLTFPVDSEVAHKPIYGSLAEGIAALQKPVDWAGAGLMPFYIDLWEGLKRAFPCLAVPFGGFGWEGPITTAWEVRGHGFFTDTYDDPERYATFLTALTDSIVDYAAFVRSLNGQPRVIERIGLYDDVASLIHPGQWPDKVLPYHEQFLVQQTDGRRHAHIENLVPDHLPHLDTLRLDSFDPSVVTKCTPRDFREGCHVPFLWRLTPMQVRDLDRDQIRRFVVDAVADGASGVFCNISRTMVSAAEVVKIHAFIDAAKLVGQLLDDGVPRSDLREAIRS